MSLAQFVLLVGLAAPTVVSQDNGWPEWPEWSEWPPSDWPEWPEWPAWKESSADSAPATMEYQPPYLPVSIMGAEEEAAISQVSDLSSDVSYATVAEALADREDLSIFYDMVVAADLLDVFQDEDFSTTIFVPTNELTSVGITALGFSTFSDFTEYIDKVVEIVLYHIVKFAVLFSGDLEHGAFLNMLSSPVLNTKVDLINEAIVGMGNIADIVQTDIVAGKSVIHIIDRFLLPFDPSIDWQLNNALQDLQAFEFESIMQLVDALPSLSIFKQAAEVAGMYPFLQARNFKGSMFIPTNEAFSKGLENLGLDSLQDLLNDPDLVETILVNHIMTAPVTVAELQNDQILQTVGQETVTVNGTPFLAIVSNGATAKVMHYNIMAGQVVVHIIDDVLLPWEVTDDMLEKINVITLFN